MSYHACLLWSAGQAYPGRHSLFETFPYRRKGYAPHPALSFAPLAYAAAQNRDSDAKVFCFFSSEKKAFAFLSAAN